MKMLQNIKLRFGDVGMDHDGDEEMGVGQLAIAHSETVAPAVVLGKRYL